MGNPQPSTQVGDSQSARTTGVGGETRGYDGVKKVRTRKRYLLVDKEGLGLKAPRSIAPRSPIRTGSDCCLRVHEIAFRAFLSCGCTQGTRARAKTGYKRYSACASR